MPTIEHIEVLRNERARILESLVNIESQIGNAKRRLANAQNIGEQNRIDGDYGAARRIQRKAQARLAQIKDEIKTLNLKHQRELQDRAEARRNTED